MTTGRDKGVSADPRDLPDADHQRRRGPSALMRSLTAVAVGLIVGVGSSLAGPLRYGLLAGWMGAAALFIVWTWFTLWPMNPPDTAGHAVTEDAGRTTSDVFVVIAAVASLGAIAVLLQGSTGGGKGLDAELSVLSVGLAWATVHTVFTTRYARLYYTGQDGGIDFNEDDPPAYRDFAYLAFTIGMTFQVSDTDLQTKTIRAMALRHALLSYLFGTVIIATTINLVAGLSK